MKSNNNTLQIPDTLICPVARCWVQPVSYDTGNWRGAPSRQSVRDGKLKYVSWVRFWTCRVRVTESVRHVTTLAGSVVNTTQERGNGECREHRRNTNATQRNIPYGQEHTGSRKTRNETLDAMKHTDSAADNAIRKAMPVEQNGRHAAVDKRTIRRKP